MLTIYSKFAVTAGPARSSQFMQTSLCLSTMLLVSISGVAKAEDRLLIEFNSPKSAAAWQTVNDGVMGGRSNGQFKINNEKNMEFTGTLSLENNGGFASVRARVANLQLSSGESMVIRVRGDGRKYNFNLYTQNNLGGYSYRQSFNTKQGDWIEVTLPVNDFLATWRGQTFPNQKLDPAQVAGFGFLLGDKKSGPFKLEVDWIKVRKSKKP